VLREEDAARANATLPLHLLEDLAGFDECGLSPRRRNKLRRARREASLVQVEDPRLFREQGYRLYVSHLARTRHRRVPSEEAFLAATARLFASRDTLVLAALAGGRLGGWVHGYAVEGTAYLDDVVVGSEFLGLQLGLALNVELFLAARRGAGIERLVHGFHAREDPGLDEFKAGLGLKVVHVPTRLSLPRPVRWALKVARPHVLYRLTGR
jgi:hypothetical protein